MIHHRHDHLESVSIHTLQVIKNYFVENYVAEALSGAAMALTGSTVLFSILKITTSNAANAVSKFFEKNILNPILTEDYATLGFPMLNFLIGITALVLFGNFVDKLAEKACRLVTRLQDCNYLPKPGDERVFLFLLPFIYYPALPFTKKEAALFVAMQLTLQTSNNALQLFSRTKENNFSLALKAAYANPAFCAFMPIIAKIIFLTVNFTLYFGQSTWGNGIKHTINILCDFPKKIHFLGEYMCLKKYSAEKLVTPALSYP